MCVIIIMMRPGTQNISICYRITFKKSMAWSKRMKLLNHGSQLSDSLLQIAILYLIFSIRIIDMTSNCNPKQKKTTPNTVFGISLDLFSFIDIYTVCKLFWLIFLHELGDAIVLYSCTKWQEGYFHRGRSCTFSFKSTSKRGKDAVNWNIRAIQPSNFGFGNLGLKWSLRVTATLQCNYF